MPLAMSPSSHCSPSSTTPLPQVDSSGGMQNPSALHVPPVHALPDGLTEQPFSAARARAVGRALLASWRLQAAVAALGGHTDPGVVALAQRTAGARRLGAAGCGTARARQGAVAAPPSHCSPASGLPFPQLGTQTPAALHVPPVHSQMDGMRDAGCVARPSVARGRRRFELTARRAARRRRAVVRGVIALLAGVEAAVPALGGHTAPVCVALPPGARGRRRFETDSPACSTRPPCRWPRPNRTARRRRGCRSRSWAHSPRRCTSPRCPGRRRLN